MKIAISLYVSEHIIKDHNVNLLLYHIVCPSKYRKKIFTAEVEETLKTICIEISHRYEIIFVEIGSDEDHVHFLVQSVPIMSISRVVSILKSITAREIFKIHPEVKQKLWGGNIWTSGYYVNTVGQYGNEKIISEYVKNQRKVYNQIYRDQLSLF